ncbi:MAG: cupin domain-containing protein [Bacteroidales bacterium]|jgi:predicted cupin superfamily sugar epimerase|nr:cupin domain-containing protein [Bacteroidales bacterium]
MLNNNYISLIEELNLQAHPEGGYYKETYRSDHIITTADGRKKNAATAIYYMLTDDNISQWHKVNADETWLFHQGETIEISCKGKNGNITSTLLGNNISAGEQPQIVIAANTWFMAKIKAQKGYSLVTCIVAPGFDFEDFELE